MNAASMRSLRWLMKKLNDPINKRLNVGKMIKFDGFSNGEKKVRAWILEEKGDGKCQWKRQGYFSKWG